MDNPWNFLAGIFFLMVAVLFLHLGLPIAAALPGFAAVVYLGVVLRKLL